MVGRQKYCCIGVGVFRRSHIRCYYVIFQICHILDGPEVFKGRAIYTSTETVTVCQRVGRRFWPGPERGFKVDG